MRFAPHVRKIVMSVGTWWQCHTIKRCTFIAWHMLTPLHGMKKWSIGGDVKVPEKLFISRILHWAWMCCWGHGVLAAAKLLEDTSSTSVVANVRGQPRCWSTFVSASLLLKAFLVELSSSPEPECWKVITSYILVHATMLQVLQLLLPAMITGVRKWDHCEGSVRLADKITSPQVLANLIELLCMQSRSTPCF